MRGRADKDGSAMLEEAEIKTILKDAGVEVGDETMKQVHELKPHTLKL